MVRNVSLYMLYELRDDVLPFSIGSACLPLLEQYRMPEVWVGLFMIRHSYSTLL